MSIKCLEEVHAGVLFAQKTTNFSDHYFHFMLPMKCKQLLLVVFLWLYFFTNFLINLEQLQERL